MTTTREWISADGAGVRLQVRVQPRASRTEVTGPHGDALRVRLAAPPVDGAANRELIAFLAKRLRLPKSAIEVVQGPRGRRKTVSVMNITPDAAAALLWPGDV